MPAPTNLPAAPPTDEIAEIDPAWLSAALGSEVSAVRVLRVGTGQMGQSWRLTIEWADPANGLPKSFVAKMAGGDPETRTLIADGYRSEYLWYTELGSSVDILIPQCWYATITDDAVSFVLLLDDLAPSEPGAQIPGATVAEAHTALREMAGLHGPRWGDPSLLDIPALRPPSEEGAGFHAQIFAGAVPQFVAQFGEWMSADDIATLDDISTWMGDWLLSRLTNLTLIHGDFRPDNLMIAPSGSPITTLDWQTVGLGFAGRDLGYFLGLGVDTELRRANERDLVATYHEAITKHGVDVTVEQCFNDYRLGTPQGPLVTVLGAVYATATPSDASNAMFSSMITRSCAAIRDLDPRTLI